ncbi:RAMP superfamily CRISPR-associated protein [Frankia sp. EAN1pec]|uniref:RAMP superfamily CRISPR-associated protein n=1 Tax=Parafrankia sp. (strain EAN1pec) TaxID=298653 RepID=UPI0003027490
MNAGDPPSSPTGVLGEVETRIDWTLTLLAETAVAVGGAYAGDTTDLTIARDGLGRPYIPGTSWAGVLRSVAGRVGLSPAAVRAVFGHQENGRSETSDAGWASLVTVHDTVVTDTGLELRTGVGIDRVTGAAADRIRFDREVLPAGTSVTLRLRYEGPAGAGPEAVRTLLGAVRADGVAVGGSTRRGLGRFRCLTVTERTVDLRSRADLLAWFQGSATESEILPRQVDTSRLHLDVSWRPIRPVVVATGTPADGAHLVPVMARTATGDGLVPILPATSVKGVLRSLAERIARTVLADAAPAPSTATEDDDVDGDANDGGDGAPAADFVGTMDAFALRVPAIEALFGSRRRAGALWVADTAAQAPIIDPQAWADHLAGQPSTADGDTAEPDGGRPGWDRVRTHVAIDRWTGGTADQQLFTVQELAGVRWPALRLEVDLPALHRALARPAAEDRDAAAGDDDGSHRDRVRAALVLLGCALGVLLDGDTGFGHGTTRGLGEVEVTGLRVRMPADGDLPGCPDLSGANPDELREMWWMWLDDLAPRQGWVPALRPVPDGADVRTAP